MLLEGSTGSLHIAVASIKAKCPPTLCNPVNECVLPDEYVGLSRTPKCEHTDQHADKVVRRILSQVLSHYTCPLFDLLQNGIRIVDRFGWVLARKLD